MSKSKFAFGSLNFIVNKDGTATLAKSPNAKNIVTVPPYAVYNGNPIPVVELAESAFHQTKVSSIIFPNDSLVTKLGANCFSFSDITKLFFLQIFKQLEVNG
ncbi:hypothetical protein TRFO_42997 [Tritrichomonas foetus]|uniref:Uncharacterized protein n=1 Tax=Tritrichomonas foetus TaxID=1144522 RepID=A0A1J4KTD9_9EUKA|nr:hypothetical protein TRFO_42997 [Tritrichomonas foetus]|eukprot:OHT14553.1 hypothetical protein TRFO_42997 [Tritrichomonas foetus]